MDLYCCKCGEPFDNDELHEVAAANGSDYRTEAANFRAIGCEAIAGVRCAPANNDRAMVASAMYELLGDDMDGAAAMMEDYL